MGYDYNKQKHHGGGDSMWTSYSDLFLGLSIVFLLLYVTASLKQGTDGIKQHLENQKLSQEAADLRQQIKVYETLKQDYLKKEASQDEASTYNELMDKLTLLQDEQVQEKNKLIAQSKENDKKAMALNKYQQLVRNIINSNMIAKSRIKSRDTFIEGQDDVIDQKNGVITEKTQEIKGLEKTVSEKTHEIEKGEQAINGLKGQLDQKMKQLRGAYEAHRLSKEKFEAAQAQARQDADSKINALRSQNAQKEQELQSANNEIAATNSRLQAAQGQVAQLGQQNTQLGQQNSALTGELAGLEQKHKGEVDKLKGDFANQEAKAKGDFDKALAAERLSGDQKAAKEAKFKADAEARARGLGDKLAGLEGKYKDSQNQLAKANERLNAQKKLAEQIKENFAKAGVKAEVDAGTGDVLLSFGDQYFDSGHAELKPKMREILQQAMPSYSKSLFENDKISKKIQSVEIVGFASPTYKGKYVDPTSLNPEDRAAVNYNLDLSYARARSIFNYVFDKNKMEFHDQQRMLPLVKVTGRSFLTTDKARDPAAAGSENFCRSNDCAKLQKVIIKFTLKD